MIRVKFLLLTAVWAFGGIVGYAQSTVKKEIDVGFADLETVRPILKSVLSPAGKFVLLPAKSAVLVIDTPQGILAAEQAIAGAALPQANVALDFQFVTGLPRKKSVTIAQEVPFPVEYNPPTIIVQPGQGYTVVPATPTKFQKRNIGVTSETTSTLNPDGSITMDIHHEQTAFEGFINYGSAILPAGGVGAVPVNGNAADPMFFSPFVEAGAIRFPIISTTRISTSIVIRPRVHLGAVELDVVPRLEFHPEKAAGATLKPESLDLGQFRTTIPIPRNETGRVYGFEGASDEFANQFFGAKDPDQGRSAIMVKATLKKPEKKAKSAESGELK